MNREILDDKQRLHSNLIIEPSLNELIKVTFVDLECYFGHYCLEDEGWKKV